MARSVSRVSIIRPLLIVASAFLLALAIERFSFPSVLLTTYAGDAPNNVVYSELKGPQSILWLADPAEPMERRKALLTVDHQEGYGVAASISPDGTMIAYAFLPTGRRDAFSEGQLWVASLADPRPKLLFSGMDLHSAPVWSPDGGSILFTTVEDLPARSQPDLSTTIQKAPVQQPPGPTTRSSLVFVPPANPAGSKAIVSMDGLGLAPIGWSQDGRTIYFYNVSSTIAEASEFDLETSGVAVLGELASQPVWNVRLSPDGRKLLYITAQRTQAGVRGAVWVFDLESRRVSPISGIQDGPVGATWHPSGENMTRNGVPPQGSTGQALLATSASDGTSRTLLEEAGSVTSVPLSWSPDAAYLAVRRRSLALDGRVDVPAVLDSRTGQMKEIKGGYAEIVGWTGPSTGRTK